MTNTVKPKYADLNDTMIDGAIDFLEGSPLELRDTQVKGLRLRLGKVRHSWTFYHEREDHGRRVYTNEALGYYDRGRRAPTVTGGDPKRYVVTQDTYVGPQPDLFRGPDHVGVKAARDKARVLVAKAITGTLPAGQRSGLKFGDAFEAYVVHLEAKAASKGKPARWAKNVRYLADSLILPMWKNWTLAEMSERPGDVSDWHLRMVKRHKAVSANHAARVVRAVYRRAARRDLSISKVNLPTAAVDFAAQRRRGKGEGGMAPADFPAWYVTLQTLPLVRRSYHLTALLVGHRPGELARTRWGDVDDKENTITIGGGDLKMGNTVTVPMTPEIRAAIAIAGERGADAALIWPGCSQASRDKKKHGLRATGMDMRRTYKTVATLCKVDPQVSEWLQGHAPEGIGPGYILRWVIEQEQAFKDSQAKISATMMRLLHAATSEKKRAA